MHCFQTDTNRAQLLRDTVQRTKCCGLTKLLVGSNMLRALGIFLTLALAQVVLGADMLRAQPIDQWHYIDEDSVLHTQRVDGLHGAGIIQSDRVFAMLYLGVPDENGVVSIVLPTAQPASEIASILVTTNGQRFRRVLQNGELEITPISAGSYAYSFPITAIDVDLFKSARSWELRIGDTGWTVTLTGSRKAIEEAERQFEMMIDQMERTESASALPPTTD